MTQGGSCSLVSELHHPQSSPKALATGSTSIELVFLEDSLLSAVLGPAAWAAPGSQLEMQTLRTLPRHTESEAALQQEPRRFLCLYSLRSETVLSNWTKVTNELQGDARVC